MYPLVFLMVGVIAGAVNLAGVADFAVQISWILIGMVLVVTHAVARHDFRQAPGGTQ
ncbi:MAG TPA: hypothetical protein VN638_01405 [Nitrospiraceae bacterium]|jgi:uncharacterized membrane protein YtjA (UPF0391 family)|nr:hypothetical protein [Nitrospiraceae bacterium]